MTLKFSVSHEPDWRHAPLAFWVHLPLPGSSGGYEPPAPQAVPHRGYPMLRIEYGVHELWFSSLAQLDHFIEVLSRKPLPTSRQLSALRGLPAGPNSHWLSRLPAALKAPRERLRLVSALGELRRRLPQLAPGFA